MVRHDASNSAKNCAEFVYFFQLLKQMSIMSDARTPPNGGKWELMLDANYVSSHLPPLGGVRGSDMIDIGSS